MEVVQVVPGKQLKEYEFSRHEIATIQMHYAERLLSSLTGREWKVHDQMGLRDKASEGDSIFNLVTQINPDSGGDKRISGTEVFYKIHGEQYSKFDWCVYFCGLDAIYAQGNSLERLIKHPEVLSVLSNLEWPKFFPTDPIVV